MSVCKYFIEGRLVKDPETFKYGDNKRLVKINVASDLGWGDNKKTVYHNCTAFDKMAKGIIDNFKKGDQIIIEGEPTQTKNDDKWYYGVNITGWSFGAKSQNNQRKGKSDPRDDNPFNDDEIPY